MLKRKYYCFYKLKMLNVVLLNTIKVLSIFSENWSFQSNFFGDMTAIVHDVIK